MACSLRPALAIVLLSGTALSLACGSDSTTLSASGAGGDSGGVTSGSAGEGAAGNTGTGGNAGTGGTLVTGDDFVSDVAVQVHDEVNTILVVTWTQLLEADQSWLEFTFEAGDVRTSRASPGGTGERRDVVLGVPSETDVTIRIVNELGDVEHVSSDFQGTTLALPPGLPRPEILIEADPERASPEQFLFGAVEDSLGGCGSSACYAAWTYWTYIMDRKGRIVWYYADPASNAASSFQRIARDGEYIWIEKRPNGGVGTYGVLKMTLDWSYFEEVSVPRLSDCIDVTDDGSLLYEEVVVGTRNRILSERTRDGQTRPIWNCYAEFGEAFRCYSNTVSWNPVDDTILVSFPDENTIAQIQRATGEVVAKYGDAPGSYAFSPSTWKLEVQHFPNITERGTLMVSSHMPGFSDTSEAVAGQHAFIEFEIDRDNQTLVERWAYNDGPEWPMWKGMAILLPNGNVLANYGTGGVIREITPDKQTVFQVKFDAPSGDDFFNKMVGHNVFIDDLYALNGGPREP